MIAPVFLDTVGLIAVWDTADQWHAAARRVYSRLLKEKRLFATTIGVMLECGNTAANKPSRDDVFELFEHLDSLGRIIFTCSADHLVAWDAYHRRLNGAAGIVDQYSFVALRAFGISECFTNDRHYKAAGFITLF